MEGDALLALMRLTLNEDKVVANLAGVALDLAQSIRDAEARADRAEAALAAERARNASLEAAVRLGVPAAAQEQPEARHAVTLTGRTSTFFDHG